MTKSIVFVFVFAIATACSDPDQRPDQTSAGGAGGAMVPENGGAGGTLSDTYYLTLDVGDCGEILVPISRASMPDYCQPTETGRVCIRPDGYYWPWALGAAKAEWDIGSDYVVIVATRSDGSIVCSSRYLVSG